MAETKIEWIREIVETADKAGIPVFLKDNLNNLWQGEGELGDDIPSWARDSNHEWLRQEFPK